MVPVVAYDVETYHPLFGNFLRYVRCFDLETFQDEARRQVEQMRAGTNYLAQTSVADFARRHSWNETGRGFLHALENPLESKKLDAVGR
jgi:hypothetical protein